MKSLANPTARSLPRVLLMGAALLFAVVSAAAADYPTTILGDNPVAFYRLDELPGAGTAIDSTTNNLNGAYNYSSVGSPELGLAGIDTNSILFIASTNGAGDFGDVDIPYNPLLAPAGAVSPNGGPFTAEFWAQPNSQPSSYLVPLADNAPYGSGAYAGSGGWNWYQTPGPGSAWCFDLRPNYFLVYGAVNLLEWYHLVATYDGNNLVVYINGVAQSTNTGATFPVNPGYDIYIGAGPDTGWTPFQGGMDDVAFYDYALTAQQVLTHYQIGTNSFRAAPTPAGILSNPQSATNYSGTVARFSTQGSGTPPFSYQWYRGAVSPGDAIAGATSGTYAFTCQYPADNNATFEAVISNNYGSITTAVATLTVLTNANLVTAPISITRNVGSFAAFRAVANGALPVSYSWSVSTDNGNTFTSMAGQTADTLWLTNVQMAQNNNIYQVIVSNPFTSISASASLSVQQRAVTVPLTGYARFVAADHPVAYWRLDETNADEATATDAIGSFDGTYADGAGSFLWDVATGIPFETDGAVGITNGATIQIPYAVELNSDTAWSVETWIQPLVVTDGNYHVVLSSEYNYYPNPYNGWYVYQQPFGSFAFVPQPGNAFITASPNDPAHGNVITAGQWYHLVITDDGTSFVVYINGQAISGYPVASSDFVANGDGINADGSSGVTSGYGNFVLGERTDAAFSPFEGTIDDTAVYNYALSAQQIKSHYANRAYLNIARAGGNVVLTWAVGTLQAATNVAGPYSNVPGASSPYTTAGSSGTQFYRLQTLP